MPALSDEMREFWAGKQFDQEVARLNHAEWIAAQHYPPVDYNPPVVDDDEDAEPVIESWSRPWEGDLPRSAKTMATKAAKVGYSTEAREWYGERRGAHGRLLDPPGARRCTVAFRRDWEAFTCTWEEINDKWKVDTCLDYSRGDETAIRPAKVTTRQLGAERLV